MIRPAQAEDLPAIFALLGEARLPTEGVAEHLPSFVVADEGGRVIACAGLEWHGSTVLLRSLVVAADRRGTGVGDAVVRRALSNAVHATRGIYALTTTAEAYLARLGFERVPRSSLPPELLASRELEGACPDSAVAMRRVPS